MANGLDGKNFSIAHFLRFNRTEETSWTAVVRKKAGVSLQQKLLA